MSRAVGEAYMEACVHDWVTALLGMRVRADCVPGMCVRAEEVQTYVVAQGLGKKVSPTKRMWASQIYGM